MRLIRPSSYLGWTYICICSFIVNVKKFVTHWMAYPVQIILGQNSIMTTAHDVQYPQKRGEAKSGQ
jgi:hypothetical protein